MKMDAQTLSKMMANIKGMNMGGMVDESDDDIIEAMMKKKMACGGMVKMAEGGMVDDLPNMKEYYDIDQDGMNDTEQVMSAMDMTSDMDPVVVAMLKKRKRMNEGGMVKDEASRKAGIDPVKARAVEQGFQKSFDENLLVKAAKSILGNKKT